MCRRDRGLHRLRTGAGPQQADERHLRGWDVPRLECFVPHEAIGPVGDSVVIAAEPPCGGDRRPGVGPFSRDAPDRLTMRLDELRRPVREQPRAVLREHVGRLVVLAEGHEPPKGDGGVAARQVEASRPENRPVRLLYVDAAGRQPAAHHFEEQRDGSGS